MRKHEWWEGDLIQKTEEDGRRSTVSARLQLIRDQFGIDRVFESNRDITARKLAEESQRKSENLLHAIIESTPDAILYKK